MGKYVVILSAVAAAVALWLLYVRKTLASGQVPLVVVPPSPATTTAMQARDTLPVSTATPAVELPPVQPTMGAATFKQALPLSVPLNTGGIFSAQKVANLIVAPKAPAPVAPGAPPPATSGFASAFVAKALKRTGMFV